MFVQFLSRWILIILTFLSRTLLNALLILEIRSMSINQKFRLIGCLLWALQLSETPHPHSHTLLSLALLISRPGNLTELFTLFIILSSFINILTFAAVTSESRARTTAFRVGELTLIASPALVVLDRVVV